MDDKNVQLSPSVIPSLDSEKHSDCSPPEAETKPPISPSGYYCCVILVAAVMVHVITDGITFAYGALLPTLLDVFKESEAALGSVGSTMYGVTMCAGPIAAAFQRGIGCRLTAIIGAVLAALGTALAILSQNATALFFTFGIVSGFGFGLVLLPAIVSVTVWFDHRRGLAMGVTFCGSGLGTVIFPPLMNVLVDAYDWRGTLLILSGITLNCAVFGALLRSRRKSVDIGNKSPIAEARLSEKWELKETFLHLRTFLDKHFDIGLLKDWGFICFLISTFLTGVAYPIPFIYWIDRAEGIGLDRNLSPWILSAIGFAAVPGKLVFGTLADVPCVNRLWLYNVVITVSGGAMIGTIGCFDIASNIWCAALYGITMGACTALSPIVVADVFGLERVDTAFGDVTMVSGIGSLIGPPIAGALKVATGSYDSTFIAFGLVMAVSGILLFMTPTLRVIQQRNVSGSTTTLDPITSRG